MAGEDRRRRRVFRRGGNQLAPAAQQVGVDLELFTHALEREAGGEALVHEAHGFELELRRVLPLAMWLTTTHEHLLSSERFAVSTKSGQLHPALH